MIYYIYQKEKNHMAHQKMQKTFGEIKHTTRILIFNTPETFLNN